jgi:DNA-binding beta-propeller fold protein YncE
MTKARTITIAAIIVLAICLVAGGCFKRVAEEREPLPEIVWPKAPEIPRISFVNSISKPEDLQIRAGMFKRFFEYLFGTPERSIVAPYGVEIDSSGRLYIVDTFLRTVHVFDAEANEYDTFSTNGTTLESPIDIAIDEERGYIYVTDSKGGSVKLFKDMGQELGGEIGKGLLERPTGIAINRKTSELLVVDTLSANIFRYALEDHQLKGIFGGSGSEEGRFHYPTNIYVGTDGIILVTDSLNFRVQVFSPEGKFLRSFGSAGDSPGYFARPRGVAADSDSNIYVVDGLFDNVQVFDKEGRLLMAFGGPGHGYGEFWLPNAIFIDENDKIYVSDYYNKRVQVFQYLKGDESLR